jgi:signal-transduction protein with cAMP-binding, CBS, and nucleotidyltransferase domain
VQVAAIGMLGEAMLDSPRLDLLVNPGVPVPAEATRIHGLGDRDLAGAPAFSEVAAMLKEAIAGRVVVGHYVGFDLAVLRHEAARAGIEWRDPPFLDIALVVAALEPALPDQGLETIARFLGVEIHNRHSALGDASAAAEVFACLIRRLRRADVRTLAEAQAFAGRRAELLRRQAAAGWAAAPGSTPSPGERSARVDRYIFERRLSEVMSSPVVSIPREATLREAARLMNERRIGALLVGAAGESAEGIVTERDLLRAAGVAGVDWDRATVGAFMSAPVQSMRGDEMLYRALGRMDRSGMRHLAVVDAAGVPVGMVSQRDLLRHRARAALPLGDALALAQDASSLAAAYARVPEVAARLLEEGLDGAEVGQVISAELRALTARAAQITEGRLAAAGEKAPAAWCLLVLGSGGRGESLLGADQDNALVHAGRPGDDAWFSRFGEGVADLLDQAGLPRCKGGVMAANAAWRGTLEDWRTRVGAWMRHATPQDLLYVDIFFDLVPVAGEGEMAEALRRDAVETASRHPRFLALLSRAASAVRPALGPFGMLRTREGRVDLKLGGMLPLVGVARVLALRVGAPASSTPARLRAASAAKQLADADADALLAVHARLMTLILRQQLADLEAGVRPSGRVSTAMAGREGLRQLRTDLRRLDGVLADVQRAVSG